MLSKEKHVKCLIGSSGRIARPARTLTVPLLSDPNCSLVDESQLADHTCIACGETDKLATYSFHLCGTILEQTGSRLALQSLPPPVVCSCG